MREELAEQIRAAIRAELASSDKPLKELTASVALSVFDDEELWSNVSYIYKRMRKRGEVSSRKGPNGYIAHLCRNAPDPDAALGGRRRSRDVTPPSALLDWLGDATEKKVGKVKLGSAVSSYLKNPEAKHCNLWREDGRYVGVADPSATVPDLWDVTGHLDWFRFPTEVYDRAGRVHTQRVRNELKRIGWTKQEVAGRKMYLLTEDHNTEAEAKTEVVKHHLKWLVERGYVDTATVAGWIRSWHD